jgi:hypothetical protein
MDKDARENVAEYKLVLFGGMLYFLTADYLYLYDSQSGLDNRIPRHMRP